MSAFISSDDEVSSYRSISEGVSHSRPLTSRGAGSPPPATSASPSPSPPPSPLRSSHSSSAVVMNSTSAPNSPEQIKVTSDSKSRPTAASFAALVRSSRPATEIALFQPPQHKPQQSPRIASLGMLKTVVTRAVRRREKASNEAEEVDEGKPVRERRPEISDAKRRPDIPQRISSTDAITHENEATNKIESKNGKHSG